MLNWSFRAGKSAAPYVRKHFARALPLVPHTPGALSVAVVGDATMARLHLDFTRVAGTTDVLTFPLARDRCGHVCDGEIVACWPEAQRRAKERKTDPRRELLLYLVHGLLHLAGMDDRDAAGYHAMHRLEDRILTQLGLGPVFHSR